LIPTVPKWELWGGGQVEAEVKRRALSVLGERQTELLTFQLDENYGQVDGVMCGGRTKVLVNPIHPGSDITYFTKLLQLISAGIPCTKAVVVDSEKISEARSGDRYLLSEFGTLMSAQVMLPLPDCVLVHLRNVRQRPRPYIEQGISYLPYLEGCR
jgi:xanthine dehydrogenase accessory factor